MYRRRFVLRNLSRNRNTLSTTTNSRHHSSVQLLFTLIRGEHDEEPTLLVPSAGLHHTRGIKSYQSTHRTPAMKWSTGNLTPVAETSCYHESEGRTSTRISESCSKKIIDDPFLVFLELHLNLLNILSVVLTNNRECLQEVTAGSMIGDRALRRLA